jgi:endonuclease G
LDKFEKKYGFESDYEFVAGGEGYDSCNGDSGGPAYIIVDGQRKVAGLTSRGIKSTFRPCGDGGIYTRPDAHKDFLDQIAYKFSINI